MDIYQKYIHHTNHIDNVSSYSFSLHPEKSIISGYIDFRRINKSQLQIFIDCPYDKFCTLKIYAVPIKRFLNHNSLCYMDTFQEITLLYLTISMIKVEIVIIYNLSTIEHYVLIISK